MPTSEHRSQLRSALRVAERHGSFYAQLQVPHVATQGACLFSVLEPKLPNFEVTLG